MCEYEPSEIILFPKNLASRNKLGCNWMHFAAGERRGVSPTWTLTVKSLIFYSQSRANWRWHSTSSLRLDARLRRAKTSFHCSLAVL